MVEQQQLLAIGLDRAQIDYRLRIGRLHRVLPRVYAVGVRLLGREGRLMAAVLWAGPASVISHRPAAGLWGALPPGSGIHLTSPRRLRSRPGLTVHHRVLSADEVTTREGIPVTTVARTLLDIAASEGRSALVRALRQAEYLRLTDAVPLAALIARYPGSRGTAVAAAVLAEQRPAGHTESELEDRFVEFLEARGIALPQLNADVRAGGRWFRVDCLWPDAGVVVELDGRAAHSGERLEADAERDMLLASVGLVVSRVGWKRLHGDPDRLEADLRAVLARRGVGPAP